MSLQSIILIFLTLSCITRNFPVKICLDTAGSVFIKKEANKQKKKKLKYAEQKALGWGNVTL